MKAYKLLWLADRYHLRQYARTISYDGYYALPHGPIPTTAKSMLDGITNPVKFAQYISIIDKNSYQSIREIDMNIFSCSDIETLDLIISKYGALSPCQLSSLSHDFPEWKKFEKELKLEPRKKLAYKIDKQDFFLNHEDGYGLFVDDEELLSLTKELCIEH